MEHKGLTVPVTCVDAIYVMKPKAQCEAMPDGKFRCKDFEFEAHCVKVK